MSPISVKTLVPGSVVLMHHVMSEAMFLNVHVILVIQGMHS